MTTVTPAPVGGDGSSLERTTTISTTAPTAAALSMIEATARSRVPGKGDDTTTDNAGFSAAPDPAMSTGIVWHSPPVTHATDDLGVTSPMSVVRGGLWSVAGRLIPQAQILVLSVVVARGLGPEDFSRQSFLAFVGLSLVLVATAGLPAALSRYTAELLGAGHPAAALALFRWTRRVEAVAAVGAAALPIGVAIAGAEPSPAWALVGVGAGLAVMQTAPAALLRGAQRWRDASLPGLITGVVGVVVTWLVVHRGGGVTAVVAVEVAVVAVNLGWTALLARRLAGRLGAQTGSPVTARRPPEVGPGFVRVVAMTSIIVVIELVVWRRSELFVLEWRSGDAELARYGIAFAAVWGLAHVVDAVVAVVSPTVASLAGAGDLVRVRRGFWRMARLLLLVAPAAAAAMAALGPQLVRSVYGQAYAGVGPVLLVLTAPLPLLPLLTAAGAALFGLGRIRLLVVIGLVAAAVDVALALALVPPYGASGAAVANVVSQLVAGVPALVVVSRLLAPVDVTVGEVTASMVAATGAGLAALAVANAVGGLAGVVVAAAAGLLVWLAAVALLRPLRATDTAWVWGALGPGRHRPAP